jgi:hypothetical protein
VRAAAGCNPLACLPLTTLWLSELLEPIYVLRINALRSVWVLVGRERALIEIVSGP